MSLQLVGRRYDDEKVGVLNMRCLRCADGLADHSCSRIYRRANRASFCEVDLIFDLERHTELSGLEYRVAVVDLTSISELPT